MPLFFFFKVNRQTNKSDWVTLFVFAVVDTNDRFLRKITVGQASTEKGQAREVCMSHKIHACLSYCSSSHPNGVLEVTGEVNRNGAKIPSKDVLAYPHTLGTGFLNKSYKCKRTTKEKVCVLFSRAEIP